MPPPDPPLPLAPEVIERLARVRLFLCDVDGILTDTSVWMGHDEVKRFNIQDGLGLRLLQREGIKVGWISNRPSFATTQRAHDLKIDFLRQADGNKVLVAESLLQDTQLTWDQVSYMGDDVVDMGVLRRAGFAATVPHALDEVKQLSHYVTRAEAGNGAVREVINLLLKAQGRWDRLLAHFAK